MTTPIPNITRDRRMIGRCTFKGCKKPLTVNVAQELYGVKNIYSGIDYKHVRYTCRDGETTETGFIPRFSLHCGGRYREGISVACPGCSKQVWLTPVLGVKNESPCNAKCTGAHGPNCECSCGGANHGGQHL